MDRLGLGYEALAAENPKLVYAAMSGMGADGPDKDMGAFDLTIQAMGGYMSLTGERDGAPVKLGTSAFDLITGQYAANGVITALLARERTGLGQKVETSLLESEVTFLVDAAMEYLTTGALRRKWGSEHANVVPYKAFQGADGWVIIGAGHQNLFEKFLKVLGRTELLADPRFATDAARVANRDAVYEVMDAEVARWTVAELVDRLNAENVPCAPVNDMEQVFTHRQVLHRGMLQRLEHPQYGEVPTIGPAVKYGAFDIASGWTAPPLVGEHTADILGEWLGEGGAGARPAAAPGG
jgi:succinate--hydroxymethylglutarate CoA-transferase